MGRWNETSKINLMKTYILHTPFQISRQYLEFVLAESNIQFFHYQYISFLEVSVSFRCILICCFILIVLLNEYFVTVGTLVRFISSVNFLMLVERGWLGQFLTTNSQVIFFPESLEEGIEHASAVLMGL